jgi:hypothetical protein
MPKELDKIQINFDEQDKLMGMLELAAELGYTLCEVETPHLVPISETEVVHGRRLCFACLYGQGNA